MDPTQIEILKIECKARLEGIEHRRELLSRRSVEKKAANPQASRKMISL